ncbi:MAG: hypothetical protein ACI8P9_001251 [Parasphingorhabdus sp.]|jgi:hypothetical protein
MKQTILTLVIAGLFGLVACTPTVRVATSDKPITINLNVKIEHEVRLKIEKELDDIFSEDSGLF